MTEPKYVKISEELRDEVISLIARVDQAYPSDRREVKEVSDQLRTAPSVETLDLGLTIDILDRAGETLTTKATKEFKESMASVCWEEAKRLEEFGKSLTKPEQSGGVVTREELFTLLGAGVMAHKPELREQDGRYELDFSPTIGPIATDLFKFIQANQLPTTPMQASEARGGDLDGLVSGELARYITNDEDLFHATQSVIAHLQQVSQGIGCGEYKIPGFDGTMWKCGGKPSSANGKTILCDDCFSTIEKWGIQQAPQGVSVPTVEEIQNAFNRCEKNKFALCAEEIDFGAGFEAIHNLLHKASQDISDQQNKDVQK